MRRLVARLPNSRPHLKLDHLLSRTGMAVVGKYTWLSVVPDSYRTQAERQVEGFQQRAPAQRLWLGQRSDQVVLLCFPGQFYDLDCRDALWITPNRRAAGNVSLCATAQRKLASSTSSDQRR
jgi:hypothetical protein